MIPKKDFGSYENNRNAENRNLYSAILKAVFGQEDDTLIAHHLCFSVQDGDVFKVEEIPSADTMIFDHVVAKHLWPNTWEANLTTLALTPVEQRDAKLKEMFDAR